MKSSPYTLKTIRITHHTATATATLETLGNAKLLKNVRQCISTELLIHEARLVLMRIEKKEDEQTEGLKI